MDMDRSFDSQLNSAISLNNKHISFAEFPMILEISFISLDFMSLPDFLSFSKVSALFLIFFPPPTFLLCFWFSECFWLSWYFFNFSTVSDFLTLSMIFRLFLISFCLQFPALNFSLSYVSILTYKNSIWHSRHSLALIQNYQDIILKQPKNI